MILKKLYLQKMLRTLASFDSGGSPYLGLQMTEDALHFHRSSSAGYIRTLGYDPSVSPIIVSMQHFRDRLQILLDEQIEVGLDSNGVVRLSSTNTAFGSEIRVHTVRNTTPWSSAHMIGMEERSVEPTLFTGININPFTLVSPPILRERGLMLTTSSGIVVRKGLIDDASLSPREALLRALHNLEVERIYLTSAGYWGAVAGGFELLVYGHTTGAGVFQTYKGQAEEFGTLPAIRLIESLDSLASITGGSNKIELSPKTGASTRDELGNPATFSLGDTGTWTPFSISGDTAKTITGALKQSAEETISIGALSNSVIRMTRGLWEVNFKRF